MGASHFSMDHASKTLYMEEATVCHNIPNDSGLHQFPNPWLEFLLHLSTKVTRSKSQADHSIACVLLRPVFLRRSKARRNHKKPPYRRKLQGHMSTVFGNKGLPYKDTM